MMARSQLESMDSLLNAAHKSVVRRPRCTERRRTLVAAGAGQHNVQHRDELVQELLILLRRIQLLALVCKAWLVSLQVMEGNGSETAAGNATTPSSPPASYLQLCYILCDGIESLLLARLDDLGVGNHCYLISMLNRQARPCIAD
jgi:hypothetical protein